MKITKTYSFIKSFKKKVLILSLILLMIPFNLTGQNNEYRFNRLSLDEGVALNLVFTMIQDHEGFIWFGTMYGLVRYDGENYTSYNYDADNPGSISFDDIVSLYEDSSYNLWIGTWGGGLNMLNPERNKFSRFIFNPSKENGISDNIIWAVTEDNDGNIWIGTGSGGIDKYDPVKKTFTNYSLIANQNNSSPSVKFLMCDGNGTIWAASNKGIYKYDIDKNYFSFFELPDTDNSFVNNANTLYDETENTLLVGTNSGLYRFDKTLVSFSKVNSIPDYRINSIAKDKNNLTWIGTSYGLIKYDIANDIINHFTYSNNSGSISGNQVQTVFEDNSGVIWINSYNSGISKLANCKSNFELLQSDKDDESTLRSNWISALAEDNLGNIWIATGRGLHRYTTSNNEIKRINIPDLSKYISTITAGDNNILVSLGNKIFSYNYSSGKISNYLNKSQSDMLEGKNINNLLLSSNKSLWIGTYSSGLYRLGDGSLEQLSLNSENVRNKSHDYILKIFEDSQNRIWIGTYAGIYLYNADKNEFTAFNQNDESSESLSNNYVYSITEDLNGKLWVGTARGLNMLDEGNKSFVKYFEEDGLPNDVIYGVAVDSENKLWISTLKGISNFDPAALSFRNFDYSDGLQANLFNQGVYLKSSKGDIFFGGPNGLNVFNPGQIQINNFDSPITIVSVNTIKENGQHNSLDKQNLKLEHDENTIVVDVAAFDYSNPERIQYKYQLNGISNNWINNGTDNQIKIQNIPPGKYKLMVMGTNSDGIWSSKQASFSFVINPPFWQTSWFYIACGILILTLIILIHHVGVKSKIKRAVRIEKIKKEEADRVRQKTAIDFHDELGHRLTRISLLTEIIKRKLGSGFSEVATLLNQISNNSTQLYEGTKDFIWAIDPHKDSMYELLIRLKDFGDELFGNTDIDFEVSGFDEKLHAAPLNMDWKRHLTLIFKEGMNNSLKHSNGKKVVLNSKIFENSIELALEDNGDGFETSDHFKGNGLKNMMGRAGKLDSSLVFNSHPNKGTKILFKGKFPVKSLNFN